MGVGVCSESLMAGEGGRGETAVGAGDIDGERLNSGPVGFANPEESATVHERLGGGRLDFTLASCCLRSRASCSNMRYAESLSVIEESEGDL